MSQDDPRDSSLESKVTLPKTWYRESRANDALGSSAMFLSGLIVVTRNRYLAWPAIIFAINSVINAHPLRTKDGATSIWSVGSAVAALISSYLPLILVSAAPTKA